MKRWWVLSVGAVLVVNACSRDDAGDDVSPTATVTATSPAPATSAAPATTSTEAPVEPGFRVIEQLALVPRSVRAGDEPLLLVTADLDEATELLGVDRPPAADRADFDALRAWLDPITGFGEPQGPPPPVAALRPSEAFGPDLQENEAIADEYGWSILDVGSFVELQTPPESFTVLALHDVTEADLAAAMGDPVDGVWSLGPEEDLAVELDGVTPARPLGESKRFAFRDGAVAVSRATPPVQEWLAGGGETLADSPALAAVAEALDAHGVYAAIVIEPDPSVDVANDLDPVLAPFAAFGVGLSLVEGEPQATFAWSHDGDAAAAENESLVRDVFERGVSTSFGVPLSELFALEELTVEGATVVATVTLVGDTPATRVWQQVYARDLTILSR